MKMLRLLILLLIFMFISGCNQQPPNKTSFDSESMWQANITGLSWTYGCPYRSLTYNYEILDWESFTKSSLAFQSIFDESSLIRDLKFKDIVNTIANSNLGLDSLLIKAEYEFESIPGFVFYRFGVLLKSSFRLGEVFIGYVDSKKKGYLLSARLDSTLIKQFNEMISQNKVLMDIDRICLSKILLAVKYHSPCTIFLDSIDELEIAAYLCLNQNRLLGKPDFDAGDYLYLENLNSIDSISRPLRMQIKRSLERDSQLRRLENEKDSIGVTLEDTKAKINAITSKQVAEITKDLEENNIRIEKPSISSEADRDIVSITVVDMRNHFAFWKISFAKDGRILDMHLEKEYDLAMWLVL